ncbi:hypothetical protein BDY19DRAFT_906543 [Irpex rosettiformis]|uniref:Uncharacterized protein n=1 Tax=Irpex rosettiformis TaxID=378272 RepID=A0ACB8U2R4_9APHY|nr:hypothetical protein BDY19DRAFT_906543 [Irpex rosettiformis]
MKERGHCRAFVAIDIIFIIKPLILNVLRISIQLLGYWFIDYFIYIKCGLNLRSKSIGRTEQLDAMNIVYKASSTHQSRLGDSEMWTASDLVEVIAIGIGKWAIGKKLNYTNDNPSSIKNTGITHTNGTHCSNNTEIQAQAAIKKAEKRSKQELKHQLQQDELDLQTDEIHQHQPVSPIQKTAHMSIAQLESLRHEILDLDDSSNHGDGNSESSDDESGSIYHDSDEYHDGKLSNMTLLADGNKTAKSSISFLYFIQLMKTYHNDMSSINNPELTQSSPEVQNVFHHAEELMKLVIIKKNAYMDVDTHSKITFLKDTLIMVTMDRGCYEIEGCLGEDKKYMHVLIEELSTCYSQFCRKFKAMTTSKISPHFGLGDATTPENVRCVTKLFDKKHYIYPTGIPVHICIISIPFY